MHLVLCIPAGIFFSIVEVILFQLSILDAIIVVFVPVLFTFFIAVLGLLLNLWKPKFDCPQYQRSAGGYFMALPVLYLWAWYL